MPKRKGLEQVAAPIPKHKHCPICGAPISMNKRFCSVECEEADRKFNRRRTYMMIITMAMFPILLIIMMLMTPKP
ncbi:MAG: DUF2116 family Zn-ribbon domain-containing protein [Candidatus Bathyarchaeia archaeon]